MPWSETVEKVAQAMYGTLSTNIHHFKGKGIYEVRDDQWDALPCAIWRAIVPQSKKDGSVDWVEERKRFLWGSALGDKEGLENEDKEEEEEEEDSEDEDEKALDPGVETCKGYPDIRWDYDNYSWEWLI